jgi:hypothetical protein
VFGETGYYIRRRGFFDYKNQPIEVSEPLPEAEPKFRHFFRAVRSRNMEQIPVSVEDAHLACLHCQIGNIAYRVGDTLTFDPDSERFLNSAEANTMLKRDYREGFDVSAIT